MELREQIIKELTSLCPFVDECYKQCTPADQENCWGVPANLIIHVVEKQEQEAIAPHWQSKPDKAGWWWMSNLLGEPEILKVENGSNILWVDAGLCWLTVDEYDDKFPNSKWLRIEQPEAPIPCHADVLLELANKPQQEIRKLNERT